MLHTLRLNGDFVDRHYLTRLCTALPQLRVLNIPDSRFICSGVSELSRLSNLEAVDLSYTVGMGTLTAHLKAPPSLRRCILRHVSDERQQQMVTQLLGPSVEVVIGQ
jgi:hypothetical protein